MRTMKKRTERTNFINYWGLYILHNGIWSCCCSTNCAVRCICFSFPWQCEQQKIINERALMYTVRVWAMMPCLLNKTKWFVTEVIFLFIQFYAGFFRMWIFHGAKTASKQHWCWLVSGHCNECAALETRHAIVRTALAFRKCHSKLLNDLR